MDPLKFSKRDARLRLQFYAGKTHLSLIVCSLLGMGAIGVVFHLNAVYFAVTVIAVVVMLPIFVLPCTSVCMSKNALET